MCRDTCISLSNYFIVFMTHSSVSVLCKWRTYKTWAHHDVIPFKIFGTMTEKRQLIYFLSRMSDMKHRHGHFEYKHCQCITRLEIYLCMMRANNNKKTHTQTHIHNKGSMQSESAIFMTNAMALVISCLQPHAYELIFYSFNQNNRRTMHTFPQDKFTIWKKNEHHFFFVHKNSFDKKGCAYTYWCTKRGDTGDK